MEIQLNNYDNQSLPDKHLLICIWAAILTVVTSLVATAAAYAGTYVINNCPSAPVGNGNPGSWIIWGSPQADKGTCSGGLGDFIAPRGGGMNPNSATGVQITVPAGSSATIRKAEVWWSVPRQSSGADNFAVAIANGSGVGEYTTPHDSQTTPETFSLSSSTTTFALENYCSSDAGPQGCVFGTGENNLLQLFGAQLTLADSKLPIGKVSGGTLANPSGPLSGTQSLAFEAAEPDSGVRRAKLLVDGGSVATNDYITECPYEDFAACPTHISDVVSWNTASVVDGTHSVQAIVESASQNSNTFYDGTITTHNAPVNSSIPTIVVPNKIIVGETLSSQPGTWSSPSGAGTISYTYQWEDCAASGSPCSPIAGATSTAYRPAPSDIAHTLRLQVTAIDNDGYTTATSAPTSAVLSDSGSVGAPNGPGTGNPNPGNGGGGGIGSGVQTLLPALGAGNGNTASSAAQLRLGVPYAINRSYAKRAFRLTGRLLTDQGKPIGNARLDLLAQTLDTSQVRIITHANTRADGTFSVTIPAGPSRLITIAYRAFAAQSTYAAQARVLEHVNAGVRLYIAPPTTGPTGTIFLAGQAMGAIPKHGVLVELLVHYRGRWVPIRTPRTDRKGRFHVAYQFQGAIGRFPFKAEIPGAQAGYAYSGGYSNQVYVHTH